MYVQSYNLSNTGKAIYTKETFTRGGKIFFAYLFIEYVLPLFLNLIFDTQPIFRLPIHSLSILLITLLLILTSILGIFAAKFTPTVLKRNTGPIKPLPKLIILFPSLVAIFVGYIIFTNGLTQYRYTSSISTDSLLIYASVIQILMPVMSFWVLMTDHNLILSRSVSDIILKVIMLLGLIFSINGLGSIIITMLFIGIFIAPKSSLGILFSYRVVTKKYLIYSGLLVLLLFIIPPFLVIGEFAKTSKQVETVKILSAYTGFNYLVNRHSIHLSSLTSSIEDGPNFENINIPFETTIYRLKLLLDDPTAEKPEITTFSRLALLQFANFEKINPKGGSSPGLLASLTMVLPLSLAAIFVFFVTFVLVKLLDFILCRQPPFSWIGAFIFAYIPLRYVTDSPFDIFLPGPIIIVLLLVLLLSFRREKI